MTILVKKPQIWGKIRLKNYQFEAKTRQKPMFLFKLIRFC